MTNRLSNILAGILLTITFLLALFSIKDDVFTFDETAHIAAGYSYLTQKDYRLNPEHPPLIKDLAAFPLLFLNLNFPKDHSSWLQDTPPPWWTQFDFATQFLYRSGNNPDKILFFSRLPMIFLLIFFGWFLFYSTKKFFGSKTALIALFFFSFSPTFLAHGRLITTDVGAAFGVVLSTYFWLKFLKEPNKKNIFFAGLIFGITMLLKFSLITLIPFFGLITIVYALIFSEKKILSNTLKYLGKTILIFFVASVLVIWPVYFYHTFNFPHQQQIRDTEFLLRNSSIPKIVQDFNIFLAKNSFFRPIAHYLLGILLAINRSATGNTTFFLGQISAEGWKSYFPFVYIIKEPLTFHILTIIALIYLAFLIKKPLWQNTLERLKYWIKNYFPQFTFLTFLIIYWLTSLTAKLNIGVRHLLPVFPFTFILVAFLLSLLLKPPYLKLKYALFSILLLWQIISVVSVYPHFLAYFNELVGGPANGHLYVVDSNLDWGQDLKRLNKWIEKYNHCAQIRCNISLKVDCPSFCYKISTPPPNTNQTIDKIYIDYFGGGNGEYYLKEKFLTWHGTKNPQDLPRGSYLAVSLSQLQGGRGIPVKGYDGPTGYYNWLNNYQPIAKIGHSIFVYFIY